MSKLNSAIDVEKHEWELIEGIKNAKDSFESAIKKNINKEMGITVEDITLISESCYHAALTDDNVNQIQRDENQILDFFTLKEVQKLLLSISTRDIIQKHSRLISSSFN